MLKRISQLASINRLQNWCYIQGDGNKSWWASQLSPGPPSLCSSPSRGTRPNRSLRRADAPPGTSWGLRSAFCSARATPSPRSAPPPALPHSYLAAATMTMTLPHQSVAVVVCSKPSSSSQARFEISSPPVSSPVLSCPSPEDAAACTSQNCDMILGAGISVWCFPASLLGLRWFVYYFAGVGVN